MTNAIRRSATVTLFGDPDRFAAVKITTAKITVTWIAEVFHELPTLTDARLMLDAWLSNIDRRPISEAIPHYTGGLWLADYLLGVMQSQHATAARVDVDVDEFTFSAFDRDE